MADEEIIPITTLHVNLFGQYGEISHFEIQVTVPVDNGIICWISKVVLVQLVQL